MAAATEQAVVAKATAEDVSGTAADQPVIAAVDAAQRPNELGMQMQTIRKSTLCS